MANRLNTRIQNKHDFDRNWRNATFIPYKGELIVYDREVDDNGNILTMEVSGGTVSVLPEDRTYPYAYERFKIGDGIRTPDQLPFAAEKIQCGTDDPCANTASQFYFKYSN